MSSREGRRSTARLTAVFLALAAIWGGGLAAVHLAGSGSPLDGFEGASLDLRFRLRGPKPPPENLVIVAIDDATIAAVGDYPPPRAALARLIRIIGAGRPATVAIDLLLLERAEADGDAALAAALAATPSVIAAAAAFPSEAGGRSTATSDDIPRATTIAWPAAPFRDRARAGVANIAVDASGAPRHLPLLVAADDALVPSFALVAAATAAGATPRFTTEAVSLGPVRQPLDLGRHLALDFYGPAGTIPIVSAAPLVAAGGAPVSFDGRIVVVGTTALASGDTFQTPFAGQLAGVEVLATAIGNLAAGDGLVRDRTVRGVDAATTLLLPALVVFLMTIGAPATGLALAAAAVAAWLAAVQAAFGSGIWLSVAFPLAATMPLAIAFGIARHLAGEAAAGRLARSRDALARLQAPMLAEQLARDPDFLATPVERDAAVLFLDLSGFTGLSERLGPQRTRDFLDAFHTAVAGASEEAGGLLAAFLGDGAMILFGFAGADEDAPRRALDALGLYAERLADLVEASPEAAGMTVRFGLHHGPVVLSRLGGATQQSITVTGDTVNVASRLLDLAKQRRVAAAVSTDVFAAADEPLPEAFGPPEYVSLRGRRSGLAVRLLRAPPALRRGEGRERRV